MSAHIIQIGKRRWLAGMEWRSFEDQPTKVELLADAEGLSADWVSVRNGENAIQAGFCAPVEGVAKPAKLFSLAAMLADSREQPWLGIFTLGNGLSWYVAVRDGHAILPDGDVVGDQDTVLAARDRHAGYDDWNYIEGDEVLLAELIAGIDAKRTPVKSLSTSNVPAAAIVGVVAVLAASLAGGGFWWHHEKQAEELAIKEAQAKMRAQITGKAAPTVVRSPLQDLAEPNAWLAACNRTIAHLPMSKKGWALGQVGCDTSVVAVQWLMMPGATVADRPEGAVSAHGDSVEETIPLTGLSKSGSDDAIALDDAKLVLRAWAQSAGFVLRMESPPIPAPLPGADPKKVVPRPAMAMVVIDMPVSPFGLDLSSLAGLRLNRIKTADAGWHLEGTLYGR